MRDKDAPGLSKDEAFEALGELYRDGRVDMVPQVGDVDPQDTQFTFTEDGEQHARELFRESDKAVLYIIGIHLQKSKPFDSERELSEALIEFAEWFAEDTGVNPLRVINRHVDDVPFIAERLPDPLVEYYDQEADNGE